MQHLKNSVHLETDLGKCCSHEPERDCCLPKHAASRKLLPTSGFLGYGLSRDSPGPMDGLYRPMLVDNYMFTAELKAHRSQTRCLIHPPQPNPRLCFYLFISFPPLRPILTPCSTLTPTLMLQWVLAKYVCGLQCFKVFNYLNGTVYMFCFLGFKLSTIF